MKKLLISIGVFLVLGTLGGILMAGVLTTNHSHHQDIESNWVTGSDCPFMSHKESLCPMDISDHVSAMRSLFETVLPTTILAGLLLCGCVLILHNAIPRPVLRPTLAIRTLLKIQQYTVYQFSYRALQTYFARGILNPKIYRY